jgi:3-hydroxy-9,10-secoandrosta-1,3,5(10)-triene-9,17-dione monooxygenase
MITPRHAASAPSAFGSTIVIKISNTADALARARSLAPALRERAARCETLRRIPDETIEDLRESDLLQLMVPRRFGGAALGFAAIVATGAELASACGSSGWVFGVFAGHNWVIGLFPERAQLEVFADPRALTASVFRYGADVTPVTGGYLLRNGRGRFSSGVDHADWLIVGVSVNRGSGPPEPRMCLVPMSDVKIVDDWHTVGMRGTGSSSVEIAEAFIPEHRTCSTGQLMQGASEGSKLHAESPVFAVPFSVGGALCLVGAPLGMARAAFEGFAAATAGKLRGLRPEQVAEKGALYARLAAAGAEIDASFALIQADCAFVDGHGKPAAMSFEDRARLRRDLAYAVGRCRNAANSLFEGAGGSAIYDVDALQRAWRDLNAASAHMAFSWDDAVNDFGRASLGLLPSPFARV